MLFSSLSGSTTQSPQNGSYVETNSGFVQVMENLESHGIFYFNFQAWKVMEFK